MSRYTHKKLYTKKYKQFIFNTEEYSISLEKSNKAISWGRRRRLEEHGGFFFAIVSHVFRQEIEVSVHDEPK